MCLSKEQLKEKYFLNFNSDAFKQVIHNCELAAKSNANVLLIGESGTGKDVAAQYIHACSKRRENPFVAVNCSAYPQSLLESELFGYSKGAFTGATKSHVGKFEQANGGTLFLDEIGDLSLRTQITLLRTLETKIVEPLGSEISKRLNFRMISATNRDLHKSNQNELFREDFFYRISTVVIRIPALRERQEDIEPLLKFFFEKSQKEYSIEIHKMVPEIVAFLKEYDFPGNIREMKSIVDRMVILSDDGVITKSSLPVLYDFGTKEKNSTNDMEIVPWCEFKAKSEKKYLKYVLDYYGGNVSDTAKALNITTRSIYKKIADYNLK